MLIGTRHFARSMIRSSKHSKWLGDREAENGRVAPVRAPEKGHEQLCIDPLPVPESTAARLQWRSCRPRPHMPPIQKRAGHQIIRQHPRGTSHQPRASFRWELLPLPLPSQINPGKGRWPKRTPETRTKFSLRPVQADPAAITLQWQSCFHPWQEMRGAAVALSQFRNGAPANGSQACGRKTRRPTSESSKSPGTQKRGCDSIAVQRGEHSRQAVSTLKTTASR